MKTPFRVFTAVVLCAVSLACYWYGRTAEAKSGRTANVIRTVAPAAGSPARADWRLGSPSSYKNLTVFPVIGAEPASGAEFITLDEGLRSGKVVITELGADGNARAIVRRGNDRAEVNRLAVTNNSGKTLVLIAGEMILGGKQDRIVGHDCIIESSAAPVPLDVFCVEHGRWSGAASFGQDTAGSGQVKTSMVGMTAAPMALPKIREKAQAKKNQSDVWSEVAKTVTVNGASTSTGTLTSVYQDKRVNARLAEYESAFAGKLSANDVIGVVAAVGGRIISADVFANHSLFQAYWPKMLKSYALEAVGTSASAAQVSKSDAEAFLARVEGSSASGGHDGVYRLAENQSTADASFELEYTRKTPTLIHFNRVSKK